LLALLEQFDGELSRTRLQKLLFLYCEQNADPIYEFVPYKYGGFSFQAAADHRKLVEKGILEDTKTWRLRKNSQIIDQLDYIERQALWALKKRFGNQSQRDLIRHVYTSYPYYALRSEIAEEYLTPEEQQAVKLHAIEMASPSLCSIGYEGLSFEGYLNKLIRRGVQLVCDVRKNPLSRKFGFSKGVLRNTLEHVGIEYRHFPELGIASEKRQELNVQTDYDELFDEYEKTTLKNGHKAVKEIADLLADKKTIALLCYERLPEQCHRTCVVNAVLAAYQRSCSVFTE